MRICYFVFLLTLFWAPSLFAQLEYLVYPVYSTEAIQEAKLQYLLRKVASSYSFPCNCTASDLEWKKYDTTRIDREELYFSRSGLLEKRIFTFPYKGQNGRNDRTEEYQYIYDQNQLVKIHFSSKYQLNDKVYKRTYFVTNDSIGRIKSITWDFVSTRKKLFHEKGKKGRQQVFFEQYIYEYPTDSTLIIRFKGLDNLWNNAPAFVEYTLNSLGQPIRQEIYAYKISKRDPEDSSVLHTVERVFRQYSVQFRYNAYFKRWNRPDSSPLYSEAISHCQEESACLFKESKCFDINLNEAYYTD